MTDLLENLDVRTLITIIAETNAEYTRTGMKTRSKVLDAVLKKHGYQLDDRTHSLIHSMCADPMTAIHAEAIQNSMDDEN